MNKRLTIIIEDADGVNKQFSAFSNNKVEHITNTKQWEYVLNKVINSFNEGFESEGDYMMNPSIDGLDNIQQIVVYVKQYYIKINKVVLICG